jgi:integrase
MDKIKDYISSKRSTLSKSSITTYASILKNLYKKVFGEDSVDFGKFDDTEKVLAFLKDMPPNRRKTILSSLVIITDKKQYRDLMAEDVKNYNKDINKQEKTPAQEASWVEVNEVKEVCDELRKNADLIYKKKQISPSDLQQIQNYIIMCVLGGCYISPRRSKDFCDFKIKNIDKEKDNYLDGKKMVFNSYKTAKTYGKQEVPIPVQLKNILAKWIKINPTDYLLFDANMGKLSSVKLNQRLNKIFGEKKVGVNQLRHTYLTDKFGDTIAKKKAIDETMTDMGSSAGMLDTYVKKE